MKVGANQAPPKDGGPEDRKQKLVEKFLRKLEDPWIVPGMLVLLHYSDEEIMFITYNMWLFFSSYHTSWYYRSESYADYLDQPSNYFPYFVSLKWSQHIYCTKKGLKGQFNSIY